MRNVKWNHFKLKEFPRHIQLKLMMSPEDFHKIIDTYIDESQMFYLVVGDGKTQRNQIGKLGYGPGQILGIYGNKN